MLVFVLQGCWAVDGNPYDSQDLAGNFKILHWKGQNDYGFVLAYAFDENITENIEKNCKVVYFNSDIVLVEHTRTMLDTTTLYSKIVRTKKGGYVYKKIDLKRSEFLNELNKCETCNSKRLTNE